MQFFIMAREVGFEPTTNRLTADCSTVELLPNVPRTVFTGTGIFDFTFDSLAVYWRIIKIPKSGIMIISNFVGQINRFEQSHKKSV
jgi:hypothetical protein